jgi:hypothetical protein
MRSLKRAFGVAVIASLVSATVGSAQGRVGVGYTDVGGVIGLGGIGDAGIALGGRFEKVIRPLPDMGDGLLGIQVSADWWSWDYNYLGPNSASVSYIPIGVTANYHFKVENQKIDPFVGAGLGYQIVNASCVINGVDYCGSYSSEIYFIAKAGIRYFTSESLAFYADVGAGAATLNLGLMFRMKGAN